ncbi:UNVERIFIED_CONTAM: hypothetical protein GTU68_048903 [Idotea baltica]|nr:hypothetical protein [Idotea baltica]
MTETTNTETTFAELKLIREIQTSLETQNYIKPTPIQALAIPHLLEGGDLLGCAQTGTGKTAAFSLPMLQRLHLSDKKRSKSRARSLILTPTRELALQIAENVKTYGRHLELKSAVVYGGVGQNPQVRAVSHGVDILIATPGRLLDLINQKHIKLDELEILVLDEADRMLDMGFIRDVRKILNMIPKKRQTLFFSATMPDEDIVARGIDVEGISHVINYELPNEPESYVHRIGRTARAGTAGMALSFCDADEAAYLTDIEKLLQRKVAVRDTHSHHAEAIAEAHLLGKNKKPSKNNGGGGRRRQPARSGGKRSAVGRRRSSSRSKPSSSRSNA